jgi:hypothetical protein
MLIVTNLLQWFDVFYQQKNKAHWTMEGGELVGENFMVGQIFEDFFEEEGEINTMDGRRHSKPSSPN